MILMWGTGVVSRRALGALRLLELLPSVVLLSRCYGETPVKLLLPQKLLLELRSGWRLNRLPCQE